MPERIPMPRRETQEAMERPLSAICADITAASQASLEGTVDPREYLISGDISLRDLKIMAALPVEALVMSLGEHYSIMTGSENNIGDGMNDHAMELLEQRGYGSQPITLHNHPGVATIKLEGSTITENTVRSLSFSDIYTSYRTKSDIDIMINQYGIVLFKNTTYDNASETSKLTPFGGSAEDRDRARLAEQIRDGFVKYVIEWGDPRIGEVCAIINKKMTYAEFDEKYASQKQQLSAKKTRDRPIGRPF